MGYECSKTDKNISNKWWGRLMVAHTSKELGLHISDCVRFLNDNQQFIVLQLAILLVGPQQLIWLVIRDRHQRIY